MQFVRKLQLFILNNVKQLRRKWLSLPLLLLFPMVIVGLIVVITLTFFIQDDQETLHIGLVDLDKTTETQLVVQLMEEASQLGEYMQIHSMSEQAAESAIQNDSITSYIMLPEEFTNNLYQGNSVEMPIIGNPNQPIQSYIIKELIDSVARHIRTSQANILTINHYAGEMGMDSEAKSDLLLEQFQEFVFYTIGKDKILTEREIENAATSHPLHYFSMSGWFIILTIWLIVIYSFLIREDTVKMKCRMKLYGVMEIQQILARIFVTLSLSILFAGVLFLLFQTLLEWDLTAANYGRIALVSILYSLSFLISLSIIEVLIASQKLRMLFQALFTIVVLLLSGAVLPAIYFPPAIQGLLDYIFSAEAFYWLQEIIVHQRFYADYIPLLIMSCIGFFILLGLSIGKEGREK
ncbi:ABC transporter permease [Virgibacillus sp. YIM 98842]|uniref:ABC transporter permease n=1 Tax=Virgibacillus sp. YIM 98842 TaxID=2663533 RepID=UPI0013DA5E79|nr:ABC transporter permease [Virgibacillus sp. YIM 98842]